MVSEGQNGKRTSTRKGRRGTKDRSLLARFDRFASTLSLSPPLYHPFTTPSALFFRSFFSLSHSSRFLISVYDTPLYPLRCLFSLFLSFFPSFSFVLFSFPLSFFLPFILIRLVLTASTSTGGAREATHSVYAGVCPSANPFSPFFHAHTPLPLPAHPPKLPRSSTFTCLFIYFLCFLSNLARNSNWSWLFNIIGSSKEKGFGGHW